jgi:hypothetical protein
MKKGLGLKGLYPTEYFEVNARSKIFLLISVLYSVYILYIVYLISSGSETHLVSYGIVPAKFILLYHIVM